MRNFSFQYCAQLLDAVEEAGGDPSLAYVARTRLRRALIALERGRCGNADGSPMTAAPMEVQRSLCELRAAVVSLSQPSEALDPVWETDWRHVLQHVSVLRDWLVAGRTT